MVTQVSSVRDTSVISTFSLLFECVCFSVSLLAHCMFSICRCSIKFSPASSPCYRVDRSTFPDRDTHSTTDALSKRYRHAPANTSSGRHSCSAADAFSKRYRADAFLATDCCCESSIAGKSGYDQLSKSQPGIGITSFVKRCQRHLQLSTRSATYATKRCASCNWSCDSHTYFRHDDAKFCDCRFDGSFQPVHTRRVCNLKCPHAICGSCHAASHWDHSCQFVPSDGPVKSSSQFCDILLCSDLKQFISYPSRWSIHIDFVYEPSSVGKCFQYNDGSKLCACHHSAPQFEPLFLEYSCIFTTPDAVIAQFLKSARLQYVASATLHVCCACPALDNEQCSVSHQHPITTFLPNSHISKSCPSPTSWYCNTNHWRSDIFFTSVRPTLFLGKTLRHRQCEAPKLDGPTAHSPSCCCRASECRCWASGQRCRIS